MPAPRYQDVNTASWQYTEPRRNPKNGLNVFLHDTGKRNPIIQLDKCRCPFGVQDGMEESARKNLELSIANEEFVDFARRLDAQNVQWATTKSMDLFRKEMTQPTVEALYRCLLAPQRNGYAPLLRVKINAGGSQATKVFVVTSEPTATAPMKYRVGSLDDLTPHCEVLPIVEVVGLWFIAKGFGMTLVATDLLVFPAPKRDGFHFSLDTCMTPVRCEEQEEEEQMTNAPEVEPSVLNAPTIISSTSGYLPAASQGSSSECNE